MHIRLSEAKESFRVVDTGQNGFPDVRAQSPGGIAVRKVQATSFSGMASESRLRKDIRLVIL
jgi:hypothetical protein